jgi:RHS repeat-associated protein
MNVGIDVNQNDTLDVIWDVLWSASRESEEDSPSVMWRAYLDGKSKAQSGKNFRQVLVSGQYSDDPTNLSYLNARYYNSSNAQFTSEDPIFLTMQQNLQDPQSLNAYFLLGR